MRRVRHFFILAPTYPFFQRLMIISALQFLSTVLYYLSLAGGPIEFIQKNLFKLGMELLFSIVTFCVAIFLAIGLVPPRLRAITMASQFVVVAIQFLYDRGDNFYSHGTYNMLIFFLLSCILLSNALSLLFCYNMVRRKDLFWKTLVIVTVVSTVVIVWKVSYYREIWGDGLLGKKMDRTHPELCSFEKYGNWPFIDLLPDGIQNFWTGSQMCPAQRFRIDAKIDANGLLTILCSKSQGAPAYTLLPDTRSMSTDNKIQKTLPRAVYKMATREGYTGPLQLNSEQESVLVHCGDVTELRFNVQVSKRVSQILNDRKEDKEQKKFDTTSDCGIQKRSKKEKPLNVLVLFFDAVSRRHMLRKLPKSMRILSSLHSPSANPDGSPLSDFSKSEGLRLFQFFRYHIVGYNTNANTRAMYTGNRERDPYIHTIAEDVFLGIFEKRSCADTMQYMVARVESNCEDWASEYAGRAASTSSFDHEMIAPMCDNSYFSHDGHPFGNFKGPYSILRRCLFDRYVHAHTISYLRLLEKRYRQSAPEMPFFITGAFIEGHEGTGEVLSTLDEDLSEYLLQLASDGTLKDTALFLVSDHGLHMGLNFVYSTNGEIEHANPTLMALLPERMLNREMIETLEHNEQALITGYNIHHTWRDLFGLSKTNTSLSFLSTKLPLNATCKSANILPQFCKCR